MSVLAFLDIGFPELVVVAFVALLLFGGRLPEVMRNLGASYRNLRRNLDDFQRKGTDFKRSVTSIYDPTPPKTLPPRVGDDPRIPRETAEPAKPPTAPSGSSAAAARSAMASPSEPAAPRATRRDDDDPPFV